MNSKGRRVYRDFTVLIVATGLNLNHFQEMLAPFGFGRIRQTDQDKTAPALIKQLKPELVAAARSLPLFSGPHLLAAARQDADTRSIPFLIIGNREDLKDHALMSRLQADPRARFLADPAGEEQMAEVLNGLLEPLVDQDKEQAYLHLDTAADRVKAGDWPGAVESLRQSLKRHEENPAAWTDLGRALIKVGQPDEAEEAFFRALELDNFNLEAYFGLAELYEQSGRNDQAVSILREALSLARQLKASSRAKSRLSFFIGEFELGLARLTEAQAAFQEAIREDPENIQLRLDVGDALARKEYFAESEEYYSAALEMNPDLAHVYNRLGIAYRRQGKHGRALDLYKKARIRHPEDEHLLFNMARTNMEAGHLSEAAMLLAEALTLSPDFKEAQLLLNRLQNRSAPTKPGAAS